MDNKPFRAGYVAIIGRPNAGKSTLLNQLLGHRLAIVTPKPQTTRHRILGILNGPDYQALLLDTPGILDPKYALHQFMKEEIKKALDDSDVVLLVIDATQPECSDLKLLAHRRALVALNKIDAVPKQNLLPLAAECAQAGIEKVFMISALKGNGVDDLKKGIVELLPEGAPFYPPDTLSERPERFFVAELIREAVFNRYGAEIPYSTTVVIEEFRERPNRKDYIRAVIYVEKESQKGILIGEGGRALKKVGEIARESIEQFLGRPVYLELWVKVAKSWRQDENFIRQNLYS
ncbi:MAG: GTPase Era [candidate division WOR-3 bacterium]|jgi:GTP-binding protein Era|nr:GTPase Era [candidate division WOR-3 bacterium]MCR4422977.1 GTPase Era [candidate division WOR-3 bacterium]MDH7518316.1 GTPase Era [bacterium]